MKSINPWDPTDVVLEIEPTPIDALSETIAQAAEAQAEWAASGGAARAAALDRLADHIDAAADSLARWIMREVGKPIAEANGEVARAGAIARYHAQAALAPEGTAIPANAPSRLVMVRRRPIGVAGLITPWNFPLAIPLWKAAPALAAGNSVVLKVSPEAIGVGRQLARIFEECLPPGVASVVYGDAEVGEALVADERIGVISFTGSAGVGSRVVAAAAGRGAPVQAEMGGKNASIVLADADLGQAAKTIAHAAMGYAGQKCTATSRVIVEAPVVAEFLPLLVDAVRAQPVGDPADGATVVGPMITAAAAERASSAVEEACGRGAEPLVGVSGGRPAVGGAGGTLMQPVVMRVASSQDPVAQEEIFAPVLAVLEAADADEALEVVNDAEYGLTAAIFTQNLDRALDFADRVDTGMVRVNQSTAGVDLHAPFGGCKASSYGMREQGPDATDFFTETYTVSIS